MKAVNLAELKNRLSHDLRLIRRSESLLVKDREQVIARIDPADDDASDDNARRPSDPVRRGAMRRARPVSMRPLPAQRPAVAVDVVAALPADRDASR